MPLSILQAISTSTTVNLQIPIESLISAINMLASEDQQKLLEVLEQRIFEAEEAAYQKDEETAAEIKAVQAEYVQVSTPLSMITLLTVLRKLRDVCSCHIKICKLKGYDKAVVKPLQCKHRRDVYKDKK
ncbi:MAG: hypothetical protein AAF716_08930 [Cyanobacteria bacterium P01_D01_bin.1]